MFRIVIIFILTFTSLLYSQFNNGIVTNDVAETLKVINEMREKENLFLFENADNLNNIADIRAKELSINFSHIRPNNTKYDELLYQNRIRVFSSDENIAYRFKNAETVVSYWMNSDQYKINILSEKFTHVGISHYAINGEDFWVVIFVQLRRQN
ncbi:CAP domain-containing protein [Brachyspira alvinipulli]|uniref:CAP domain-containing protein n=1 Tax=Brachyspira alvinipulli TaxID=84379 RepID=UPI00262CED2F|nr:CAP domain-containing protein [uncultured Brachyspira sp.]